MGKESHTDAIAPNKRMQRDRFALKIGAIFMVLLALAAADAQAVGWQP